jgi:hypothetical protein
MISYNYCKSLELIVQTDQISCLSIASAHGMLAAIKAFWNFDFSFCAYFVVDKVVS